MIAACAQLDAQPIEEARRVWPVVGQLANEAAAGNADLIVYPEATYPAYWLDSKQRYWESDIERCESVLGRYSALAARHACWIVAGFVEEIEDRLFNSAAVFDRRGTLIGITRKNFLWDCDHNWFSAGDELSVFETEFGRMGVLICADVRMPEIPATLVSRGARFIVQPTAWVNTSATPGRKHNIQPAFLIEARAREFAVPFLCASKSGREGSVLEYVGLSRIVDKDGTELAGARGEGDELIVSDLNVPQSGDVRVDRRAEERLLSGRPPFRPLTHADSVRVNPMLPMDSIVSRLEAVNARIGWLKPGELESFAAARCSALDGVQVILARDADSIPIATLRTRAAENRVFILACSNSEITKLIDPDGNIAWENTQRRDEVEIRLVEADNKQFTPTTDIWKQRRPECYEFRVSHAQPS